MTRTPLLPLVLLVGCTADAPAPGAPAAPIPVESELVVDGSDPAHALSDIVGIRVTDDGSLYVLDYLAQELTCYRPGGEIAWVAGGRGQGPGEFMGASGLALDPEGRPRVWDPMLRRFTVITPTGVVVETRPRVVSGMLFPWPGRFVGDELVDWAVSVESEPPGTVTLTPFTVGEAAEDTIRHAPLTVVRPVRQNGRTAMPFAKALSVAVDGTGEIWFAETDRYRIHRRSLAGDTLRTIQVEADPRPIPDFRRDSAVQASLELSPEYHVTPDDVPDFEPVILRLIGDERGERLYVVPALAGHDLGRIVDVHDLFDSTMTRYLLPERLQAAPAPIVKDGWLWYVTKDAATDVPSVRRVRLGG